MDVPFDAQIINQKGWRQGSICLDLDIPDTILRNTADGLGILLSHDCDIVQPDIKKEPNVEFLIAFPVSQLDGNYIRGKNSRCYHFQLHNIFYEIKAFERISVPRYWLIDRTPHPTLQLPVEEIRAVVHWFAQRYECPAFPNNFNKRFSKKSKQTIEQILKNIGHIISGIYIACPQEEYSDDFSYDILFYVVMSVEIYNDIVKLDESKYYDVQNYVQKIYETIKNDSKGINIYNSDKMCINEITLHDLHFLKRFTSFDHFSFDTGIEPMIS
ncbi:MAG: hypothetical protein LBP87_02720 [Planctomycetaceae bacterium]|jgi:hypothetical protein|nr:hypothetical protein [Planctomycetaceae bacterium]